MHDLASNFANTRLGKAPTAIRLVHITSELIAIALFRYTAGGFR